MKLINSVNTIQWFCMGGDAEWIWSINKLVVEMMGAHKYELGGWLTDWLVDWLWLVPRVISASWAAVPLSKRPISLNTLTSAAWIARNNHCYLQRTKEAWLQADN